jgi:NADH-quinone oxidoreductase subunit H
MSEWLVKGGYAVVSVTVAAVYGLLLSGIIARTLARSQGRIGVPVWQGFLDVFKHAAKRTAISHGVMFYLGPILRLTGGIGTLLFVPMLYGSAVFGNFHFAGDIILIIYFILFGALGMALGASEGGHPYSAIGIGRGLAQFAAFEVPFALAVISLAIQYDTLSVYQIVGAQQNGIASWTLVTNPLATIAAMISLLGSTGYSPFDIVGAPQEIPIGPRTEFQSDFISLMQLNRAIFAAAKLVLYMDLFFGGATNLLVLMVKTWAIYMVPVFVGAAFPRYRIDQSIRFFLRVPTLIGIAAVIFADFFFNAS